MRCPARRPAAARSRALPCRWCRGARRRAVGEEDVQHLGGADAVEELGAGALGPALADFGGQRFAGGRADSQIEFCTIGKTGVDEQGGIKRRHAIEDGRLVLDQALEHRVRRRPLRHQDGRGAHGEREGQRVAQAVGEEELRRGEHDVGFPDAEHRHGVELGGEDEVRVQVHRALRRAGRARRVEPEAHVVAQRWGGLRPSAIAEESNSRSLEWATTCVEQPKPSKFFSSGSDTNSAFARLSLIWYS